MDEQIIKVDSDTVKTITPQPDLEAEINVENIVLEIEKLNYKLDIISRDFENEKSIIETQINIMNEQLLKAAEAGVTPDGIVGEPVAVQAPIEAEPIEEEVL